ncbi:Zinc finger CCCH domain-containing protein 29 [Platanthera guangdongensis]|uniref:Zinc finger CCCH domain-containing protein 29 n=1 Tax=Platanthera guangdongensis TaxID=2320717 RepID=A0ABR2M8J5_9ASPA
MPLRPPRGERPPPDPRKFSYSCVPCLEFRKASCLKGDACEYAHGVFESWLHPAQYRTRLCKDETACYRRVCFFAHKPEELRAVNPTSASIAGTVLSSPKSSQVGVSSFDMAAALVMQSAPGSPMSPSASSSSDLTPAWTNPVGSMVQLPSLYLPSSRLKSSLSARDINNHVDLLQSPRTNWKSGSLNGAVASRVSDNYNNLAGSLDPSMLCQLQGCSLKLNQNVCSQKLLSGYGGSLPSSPRVNTSSFGLEHSMVKAIMNSRQAAFGKKSNSFVDRVVVPQHTPSMGLSDWGSPKGKLDWGIQEDELNKLRRSASFNSRSNAGNNAGAPAVAHLHGHGLEQQQQKQYLGSTARDFLSWEQLYGEDRLVV